MSRSIPPESRIASWDASWLRSKSRIEHSAMTVEVWFPPYKGKKALRVKKINLKSAVLFCFYPEILDEFLDLPILAREISVGFLHGRNGET